MAIAPDGRLVATSAYDGTAALWDVTRPSHPARLAVLASRGERSTQRRMRSQNGHPVYPVVAVRGKPTVPTDRPRGPDAAR